MTIQISKQTARTAEYLPQAKDRLVASLDALAENFPKSGVEIIIREAKQARSLDQNSISHAWYAKVEAFEKEYTAGEVKNLCKYHFGLPIMRGDDADFNEFCCLAIDPLTYEQRVKAMEYSPVTSLMGKRQMSKYLEAVQRHYAGRVPLVFPGEEK